MSKVTIKNLIPVLLFASSDCVSCLLKTVDEPKANAAKSAKMAQLFCRLREIVCRHCASNARIYAAPMATIARQ